MTFKDFRDGIQHGVYRIIDPAVRALIKVGVTPNMITTLGLLGNLLAAYLIVRAADSASLALLGWAGFAIIAFSIMDMVDGYMARTGHLESEFGAFYDSVLDRYCELATLSALAYYFMQTGHLVFALWTFLALIGSIMVSYIRARAEGLGKECKVGLMQRPERVVVTSLGLLLCGLLSGINGFDALWCAAAPMILIAILANGTAIVRILHVRGQMDGREGRMENEE